MKDTHSIKTVSYGEYMRDWNAYKAYLIGHGETLPRWALEQERYMERCRQNLILQEAFAGRRAVMFDAWGSVEAAANLEPEELPRFLGQHPTLIKFKHQLNLN
jgi:hypothetical protein